MIHSPFTSCWNWFNAYKRTFVMFLRDRNHPVLPGISSSPSQQRSNTGDLTIYVTWIYIYYRIIKTNNEEKLFLFCLETPALPGDGEDYVADSEDEATKNFKGRVCIPKTWENRVSMGILRGHVWNMMIWKIVVSANLTDTLHFLWLRHNTSQLMFCQLNDF